MERSPELKAAMLKYYDAMSRGDASVIDRLISKQRDLIVIGTDPKEWWTESDAIDRVVEGQAQAGLKVIPGNIEAFREGSVGWVADRAKFVLPDGKETPVRSTAVFHQEGGEWKLIQAHASVGVPNEELLGAKLDS
jgi:hypothetical protein